MTRFRVFVSSVTTFFWASALWAQNRMVDTEGAVELKGSVELQSRLAVLLLFLGMVLLSVLVALLFQRADERRAAQEIQNRLESRLAAQEQELEQLRSELGKSSDSST